MTITPNTTTLSSGMATTKIHAARTLTVNAMIMAPNTTNGLRRNRRKNRFSPFCTWLMSLVMRVIKVLVPRVSISEKPSFWICSNRACRSEVE